MKEEIVHRKVLNTILAFEVSKGHLRWKVADVARKAGVSRPLIYYHFGKTKKAILQTCIALIGEEYYGLGKDRESSLTSGRALESLRQTRAMFLANPALVVFYQRWRMEKKSPIGEALQAIERRYQAKIRAAFPGLSDAQVQAFHALLHGVISAPFLDGESFDEACGAIFGWVKAQKPSR